MKPQLIFVYNATSNPVALLGDFIAELMPQKETNCNLCSITYSLVYKKRSGRILLKNCQSNLIFTSKTAF